MCEKIKAIGVGKSELDCIIACGREPRSRYHGDEYREAEKILRAFGAVPTMDQILDFIDLHAGPHNAVKRVLWMTSFTTHLNQILSEPENRTELCRAGRFAACAGSAGISRPSAGHSKPAGFSCRIRRYRQA